MNNWYELNEICCVVCPRFRRAIMENYACAFEKELWSYAYLKSLFLFFM